MFLPVLLYGSECWTALDNHVGRIMSAEIRFLRRIVGTTRRDCVRNERIREDLDVKSVRHTIQERQLKWYGHVYRIDDTRKARWYLQARPEGSQPRGRPRCKYSEYIGKLGAARGHTILEMRRQARDQGPVG
nr:uncharacterized protein LOC112210741 [Halyomorpha halys]